MSHEEHKPFLSIRYSAHEIHEATRLRFKYKQCMKTNYREKKTNKGRLTCPQEHKQEQNKSRTLWTDHQYL